MLNKVKIVHAMGNLAADGSIGYKHLAGIIMDKTWLLPEEGDRVNYKFVYDLLQAYLAYAKTIEIPLAESIVYENLVKYLASLVKQDPAYHSRFNGILFRILHDYSRGKISGEPGANLDYITFLVNWWDTFDGRERNHGLYKQFLEHIVMQYSIEPFYQRSIDFCLNWVGNHQCEFIYSDDMNPKKWYGNCGVGVADNMCMGGFG